MNKTGTQLARALFDAGDFDEALKAAGREDDRFKAGLLRSCILTEREEWDESLAELKEIEPLYDAALPGYKSSFHHQRALGLSNTDQSDDALIDYEFAEEWARQAGDKIKEARAKNNRARLLSKAGRLDDALQQSDMAISIARTEQEMAFLGRFLDQRAQILHEHGCFSESADTARQAVEILEKHGNEITIKEARTTYGKALVRLGSSYLPSDSLDGYHNRKAVGLMATLDKALIDQALEEADGKVFKAANLLGVSHSYVIKIAGKKNLTRQPRRTRHKSLAFKAK